MPETCVPEVDSGSSEDCRSPVAWLPAQDMAPEDQLVDIPRSVLSREHLSTDEDSSILGRCSAPDMPETCVPEVVYGSSEDCRSQIAWLPAQDMAPEDQLVGIPRSVLSREHLSADQDGSILGRCSAPDMPETCVPEVDSGSSEDCRSPVAWLPAQDMAPEDQLVGIPRSVFSREHLSTDQDRSILGRCSAPDMPETCVPEVDNGSYPQ
ncbi:uncharacterized protein LOC134281237 [Saccostrea cucullata]|uniref:uncharacterized protein LOC134281237 n=1 Tax=Saccostrea cuccullata TaxID=36930 RepID=UPI002ED5EFCF